MFHSLHSISVARPGARGVRKRVAASNNEQLHGLPSWHHTIEVLPMRALRLGLLALVMPIAAQTQVAPVPRSDSTARALSFTFPGMQVGVAEYEEGPTGTTVFYFPEGVKAAVDVRGGAPGTLNSDAVRLGYESPMMHAVVFSGGSWYGLSAATGVANELKTMHAEQGEHDFIAGVLGGIIFDVGDRRFTRVTPDDRLGGFALRSSREGWFPLGARGAGRFAMQGDYYLRDTTADAAGAWPHSGQGGAFRQVGPTRIAVFTVVNASGAIVGRDGGVLRCRRNSAGTPCPAISALIQDRLPPSRASGGDAGAAGAGSPVGPTGNTTLTLVVTNQKLPWWALQRLAVQVHGSMSRAIQPFATEEDGDLLYAVTTDEVENPSLPPMQLSTAASELAWDAVLNSFPDLPVPPAATTVQLSPTALHEFTGEYQFPGGGMLSVTADSSRLAATFSGKGRIYFDAGRHYRLVSAGPERFLIDAPASDVIQFERRGERVVGITLNPGPWSQRADKRK